MDTSTIRELRNVAVAKITTGLNVRTSAEPDADLVASVKANGILQPPTVTELVDGTYEIIFGHRRTNAAALAGLTHIDVLVVDGARAEELRLVEQIVENEQRLNLTDAERLHGYRQLELFSVSPADIAKRLGVKRSRVDQALAVANNDATSSAVAEFGIGMDDAALILDTTTDPDEIKALSQVASTNPARLSHELHAITTKRAYNQRAYELTAELTASGVRVLAPSAEWWGRPTETPDALPLADVGNPSNPAEPATVEDLPVASLVVRVAPVAQNIVGRGYLPWPTAQYFVVDLEEHGLQRRVRGFTTPERTPEEQAKYEAEEARRAERRATIDAAATVRREFTTSVLTRKNLPAVTELLAKWIAQEWELNPDLRSVLARLGHPGLSFAELPKKAAELAGQTKHAERLVLAMIIDSYESVLTLEPAFIDDDEMRAMELLYLTTLETWGYGLSAVEQEALDYIAATAADSGGEDADDEGEGDE